MTRSQGTCKSNVCKEVAGVYEKSLNYSIVPCSDFFTYVCSGWLDNVRKGLEFARKTHDVANHDLLERAVTIILLQQLKRVRNRAGNATSEGFRESELQPSQFFKSCVRALRRTNWNLNILTLRKFFHEIGLPFFDERADPNKTAFSVLMNLALQFGISPIFAVEFGRARIWLRKSYAIDESYRTIIPTTPAAVRKWKNGLLTLSNATFYDVEILTKYGSLLDAFHIHVSTETLLRLGRNFNAVELCMHRDFIQKTHYDTVALNQWSKELNSTYYDLFDEHMGNLGKLKNNFGLTMARHFFEPLVIVTKDPSFTRIFYDFLALHLLQSDFMRLVGRTRCAHSKNCDQEVDFKALRSCALLTKDSFRWSTAAMVARATHTDYTGDTARFLFSLFKCFLVTIILQRVSKVPDMDIYTRLHVMKFLVGVRARGLYPESLDRFETTELGFSVSPYDLVHNLIEVSRAKRALSLTRLGYPFHRNVTMDVTPDYLYVPAAADVYLPARLLEFPIMVETLPTWSFVGSFGLIIGHELSHALVMSLREYADMMIQIENRTDTYYYTKYTAIAECFGNLYKPPDQNKLRMKVYYDEAIADHISLQISYDALKWFKEKKNLPKLPTKFDVSIEEMFFISRAYVQCYASTDFSWTLFLTHPPYFHRVNRGLSNFRPFGEVFECVKSDNMVAKVYCDVMESS